MQILDNMSVYMILYYSLYFKFKYAILSGLNKERKTLSCRIKPVGLRADGTPEKLRFTRSAEGTRT